MLLLVRRVQAGGLIVAAGSLDCFSCWLLIPCPAIGTGTPLPSAMLSAGSTGSTWSASALLTGSVWVATDLTERLLPGTDLSLENEVGGALATGLTGKRLLRARRFLFARRAEFLEDDTFLALEACSHVSYGLSSKAETLKQVICVVKYRTRYG